MKTISKAASVVLVAGLLGAHPSGFAAGSPDITIVTQPVGQAVSSGATVTFAVVAAAPGQVTYEWMHGGRKLSSDSSSTSILTLTNVQIGDAGDYSVAVHASGKKLESAAATLTVDGIAIQDVEGPKLKVNSPAGSNVTTTNAQQTFSGTASDDTWITGVCYQQGAAPWVDLGTNIHWTFSAGLSAGTNVFKIKSVDVVGNYSATQQVVVFYSVSQPLVLAVSGTGSVLGATNGELFELGKNYTLRAAPAPGFFFSHWDVNGDMTTNSVLTFYMWSNRVVTATFTVNPFVALQGTYHALFYDAVAPVHESSGILSFKLTDNGRFTGKGIRAGETLTFSGQFGVDLAATVTANRRAPNPPVTFVFQLAADSDEVTGTVSGDGFSSGLAGYRAPFSTRSPATQHAGKFTLAFAGSGDSSIGPEGTGYASVTVSSAGAVQTKGVLSDGVAFTHKGNLAANGQWPFYVPLHQGRGSILGWLTLADDGDNDLTGLVLWTRPAGFSSLFFPLGFASEVEVKGSRYETPPSGTPVLTLSNPIVYLEGGNLDGAITADVVLETFNKLTFAPGETNKLALKVTTSSGLVGGNFVNPQTLRKSSVRGVVLQRQNVGTGFFLGTNQSGLFFLGEAEDHPVFR